MSECVISSHNQIHKAAATGCSSSNKGEVGGRVCMCNAIIRQAACVVHSIVDLKLLRECTQAEIKK